MNDSREYSMVPQIEAARPAHDEITGKQLRELQAEADRHGLLLPTQLNASEHTEELDSQELGAQSEDRNLLLPPSIRRTR